MIILINILWLLVGLTQEARLPSGADLDDFLTKMDNRIRPNVDGPPVVVRCNVYVVSFGSINEKDMDYTINIYLRQRWTDPRFEFNETQHERPLVLDATTMKKVWMPDIFFPNEKRATFHDMTVPNRMMRVFHNGTIIYSLRLTMTVACSMNLYKFPMDDQQCSFKMESYSYGLEDLVLEWFGADPVEVDDEDMELPQFDLTSVKTSGCIKTYKTGSFPCLKATFYLHRQFGFYLLQTYVPTVLIVILSWVSFWLHVDAVPARISLGVTTVLTMATQLSGSRENSPKVSYPKALDVWMAACMLFVFSALLEYAFVNVLARGKRKQRPYTVERAQEHDLAVSDGYDVAMEGVDHVTVNNHTEHVTVHGKHDEGRRMSVRLRNQNTNNTSTEIVLNGRRSQKKVSMCKASFLDNVSKVVFPLAFLLFNGIYWPVYFFL